MAAFLLIGNQNFFNDDKSFTFIKKYEFLKIFCNYFNLLGIGLQINENAKKLMYSNL